jgi:hypothetical protein
MFAAGCSGRPFLYLLKALSQQLWGKLRKKLSYPWTSLFAVYTPERVMVNALGAGAHVCRHMVASGKS